MKLTEIEKLLTVLAFETNHERNFITNFTLTNGKGNVIEIEKRVLPNNDYIIFDKTNNIVVMQVTFGNDSWAPLVYDVETKYTHKISYVFDDVEDDGWEEELGPQLGGISGALIKSPPYYDKKIEACDGKASFESTWIECKRNLTPDEEEMLEMHMMIGQQ